MVSVSLLLVRLEHCPDKNRLSLKRIRQIDLGDRWDGRVEVKGDTVVIGEHTGILADENPGKRQVIKVKYRRPAP
jgi:hypothetical protein